jgi:hypothetical protein
MKMHALFWAVCAVHGLILMPAHSQSLETQERVDAIEGETEAIQRELEALSHAATALVQVEEAERRCVAAAEAKSFLRVHFAEDAICLEFRPSPRLSTL